MCSSRNISCRQSPFEMTSGAGHGLKTLLLLLLLLLAVLLLVVGLSAADGDDDGVVLVDFTHTGSNPKFMTESKPTAEQALNRTGSA
jgi:hypothetical protein